jgi:hypothetical protein
MGNPQETLQSFEFGWFAGFIDGEGAIGISKRNRPTEKTHSYTMKPHMQVCNTEYILIEKCMYVLDQLSVPYHISEYPSPSGNRQPYWTLTVAGQQRVMKLLPALAPLLQSVKREKAELVIEFCQSRENRVKGKGYTEKELHIVDTLYDMNKRGKKGVKAPQRLHARHFDK